MSLSTVTSSSLTWHGHAPLAPHSWIPRPWNLWKENVGISVEWLAHIHECAQVPSIDNSCLPNRPESKEHSYHGQGGHCTTCVAPRISNQPARAGGYDEAKFSGTARLGKLRPWITTLISSSVTVLANREENSKAPSGSLTLCVTTDSAS